MSRVSKSLWGVLGLLLLFSTYAPAQDPPVSLKDLVDEALKNNPEILSAEAKAASASERISQSASPADPMLSVGYQNGGFNGYTYGNSQDSWWMLSLAQTFPFPGKLSLQQDSASLEAEAEKASAEQTRREVVLRVSEAFYDLLLAAKELDLISERKPLASRLEDASLARYSSGVGSQVEVIMAQAEKYMLIEKEEMAKRRIESIKAMLNREVGRETSAPIGRPVETPATSFHYTLEELLDKASSQASELVIQQKMLLASEKKLSRSKKEAWPDVTLAASYFNRGNGFDNMWALTASVPLPVFYKSKQGAGISEATWNLAATRKELDAARFKIESDIRDNLAMVNASERVIELYRKALIPNARKDIDAVLAQYASGRIEAATTLAKLKAPFDYELTAWQQYVEREKAIARIKVFTGDMEGK
jgi:outer membrane protein, heavy metal efflux system